MNLNTAQLLAIEYCIAALGLFLGYKCITLKKENMNYFGRFMIELILYLLFNIPVRYSELHIVRWNREFVFFLYAISLVLMTFMMYYWFIFVMKQINSKLTDNRLKVHLWMIPALWMIPLCIANRWTGWLYVIDEYSWYSRGSAFILQAIISYGYFILLIVCNTIRFFSGKERAAVKKCFLAIWPGILGAVLQVVFGGSYVLVGSTFAALIMYVEICLDRQKAYELMDAMAAINNELAISNKEKEMRREEAVVAEKHAQEMKELFAQTAEALAEAIDAKDRYTHGHSVRVAEYSLKLAKLGGMSEEECEQVYFAGLLHDVGKIGIPDTIICKDGKLTDEEFAMIKAHPVTGKEILSNINMLPYLSVGAHHHHERYDGRGYPDGLAGNDIPELARVIAVADAYDAMTSKRSYRDPLPQQKVRDEFVNGTGKQFDPKYAVLMVDLIDHDQDYKMKEN